MGVWAKGRGHTADSVANVARYIPRARIPWQPSQFHRENLTVDDMTKMWGRGRYRTGYGNYNSGYSTEKTKTLEDTTIQMIPKHELEKYMPDISLGPKALVTPVSLMSARNGHRVTHDMLHSYDPYVGRHVKPAMVDHDNINPHDSAFVGLNAAALDCRSRIHRWLRRGPFFQEDHYFRRYVTPDGVAVASPAEASLFKRIVRLASKGHFKGACEEYRKITSVAPVEVYRALTAACVPNGNLGDAISIFEEGNSKLFYVARDGEVLWNLMSCAITAKNRPRVVWIYNVMRGRYFENKLVRAEIDPVWQYRIVAKGLVFLLDTNATEEARVLYSYLQEQQMLAYDLEMRQGNILREAIAAGKAVSLSTTALDELPVAKDTRSIAPAIVEAVKESMEPHELPLHSTAVASRVDDSLAWLQQQFSDIDVAAVMRLARFRGRKDLMAKDQDAYITRTVQWLQALSQANEDVSAKPLSYLRKSKPSTIHDNLRVAWIPDNHANTKLLPNEQKMSFFFKKGARFVTETFPIAGKSIRSMYLAQQPVQTEVSAALDFTSGGKGLGEVDYQPRIVHIGVPATSQQPIVENLPAGTTTVASMGTTVAIPSPEEPMF